MIKKLAFVLGMSFAIGAQAQLDVEVNKNYKILRNMVTTKVSDRMLEQHMGMDVNSKGDIIVAYTARDNDNGKDVPITVKYKAESGYESYKWKTYKGFKSTELINEIKVLNDDWVVVAGMGFVMFVNEDLALQYALDVSTTEDFRDADFMEIDQTADGKIVVLYSYNYDNVRDELGLLVVDREADDFYYAKIGYTGNWDFYKKDGGTAKSFEMAAVSNDYCVVGFNPSRNDKDEYDNAYIVVDINKVINAGDAAKVDAVVKYGHFSQQYYSFNDMAWDPENKRLHLCIWARDGIKLLRMKVEANSSGISITEEKSEKMNSEKWKSPTGDLGVSTMTYFSKNGYSPKLVIGGESYESLFYERPNLNVFSGNSLSQTSGAGRAVIGKRDEQDDISLKGWEIKEIKYIGKSLASQMNGNYEDAFAVLIYKEGEERAKLILVDVSYMGL